MLLSGPSARFGQPALNEQDTQLVKYFFLAFPLLSGPNAPPLDPKNGFPGVPDLPADQLYATRDRHGLAGAIVFGIVFLALALMARVGLRFWIKQLVWGWDDFVFVLASIVGILSLISCLLLGTVGGFGQHIQAVTYAQLANHNHLSVLLNYTFYFALALVRASVVLWIRRVVGMSSRAWSIFTLILLIILAIYSLMNFILWPISFGGSRAYYAFGNALWAARTNTHWNGQGFIMPVFVLAIIGAVLDVILVFVPVVLFMRTSLPTAKRIRLSLLCCVGAATTATSIKRCVIIRQMNSAANIDNMWSGFDLNVWTVVETFLSFLVGSTPMINSVGVHVYRKYIRREEEGKSYETGSLEKQRTGSHTSSDGGKTSRGGITEV